MAPHLSEVEDPSAAHRSGPGPAGVSAKSLCPVEVSRCERVPGRPLLTRLDPSRPIPLVFFGKGVAIGVLRHPDRPGLAEVGRNFDGKRTTGAFDWPGQRFGSKQEVGPRGTPPRLFQIGTRFPFWNQPHRPSMSTQEVRKGTRRKSPICPRLVLWEFQPEHQVDILPADCAVSSHSTEVARILVNACCQRGFGCSLLASPAHRLLSAGSREGLREGVGICISARFLA